MATTQRNKRWLRKILYGVLILTGIVTVVLFYLIATFDIEAYRVKIKSIISQSLDREVRIDGKIGLEPSLWPRFVVEDISIGNPSWATVSDLAKVKRFEIQVALLPLLWKELKILELNLIGVHVHLERDEKNTPNWLMKRLDSGKLIAKVLPALLAMHIKDSIITWHVKERPPITLSIVKLETTLAMDEPFKLEGNLIYKDIPIGLFLRCHLGRLSELISKEKPFPLNFRLKAADMTAEFTGFLQKPLQDFAVVGGLEIQAAQLTTLIRLLGQDWERNQPLSISGQLEYKSRKLYLREAKLATGGVSMTGEVTYVSDDSPICDIHLQTILIDLSKYIKPVDKTKNGISASTLTRKAQRVIPDVSLNTNLLKSLSTAIQIDDLKVMHGATHITTIKAKLSIVNGVLSLSPFEGRSPTGSSSQASLVLDTSVEPPQAALFINTKDLDYGLILNSIDITKNVVGTLNLKLDLKGQGLSLRELLGNANGDLEIVTDKGRIPKRLLELWGGDLVRLLIPTTWFEKDVTDLNCAVCRFEINDGIMQSNLMLADTERITVVGETVLDLKTEQVSCLFNPKNKEAVLFRLGTPIKVTGTLAEIKAEPARSGIVTFGKLILGLSYPGSLILLFGDLGTTEKNPCEALLHHPLSKDQPGVQQ